MRLCHQALPWLPNHLLLVMMSSAPAKSVGYARYASRDPFIR